MPVARSRRLPSWGLALAAAAVLAGCANVPAPGAAPAELRTASDQSDTDRRAQVRLELASAYFERGQAETALDEVKRALAADPKLAPAHNLRGLIYAALDQPALAQESFQRALQLDARDAGTMHNYGWFLCQQQRWDDAQAQFERALAQPRYDGTGRTLLALGVCQARAQRWAGAQQSLSQAFDLDPGNPVVAVNLAEVLLKRGEAERARFYVERVNRQPQFVNAQSLWLAARIEHRLGHAAAVDDLARQLRQRYPQAPQTLALDQGRFDE